MLKDRVDQKSAKKCCRMGWIGCPILQLAQKAILIFQFLVYFKTFCGIPTLYSINTLWIVMGTDSFSFHYTYSKPTVS